MELAALTSRAAPLLAREARATFSLRGLFLAVAGSVPPLIARPSDGFDGYFALKAYAVIGVGVCLCAWWAVTATREGHLPGRRVGVVGLLALALAIWLTISTLCSVSPATGVWGFPGRDDGLLVWLSGLLIMASAAVTHQWREWRIVLASILGTACLLSLYGVAQHFGADLSDLAILARTGRVFSSFRNPIFFGGYLALVAPLLLCATVSGSLLRRVAAMLGLGVALAALYLTFTRAAWLGAAGGLVLFLLLSGCATGRRRMARAGIGLAVAAVVAWGVVAIPTTTTALETHDAASDLATLGSVSHSRNDGRVAIWEISLRMIADRPVLGLGLDQMGSAFESYRTERFDSAEGAEVGADRAHSDPLHLAVVAGVPAALLYCALVLVVVGRAATRCLTRRDAPEALWHCAMVAGVCAYLAQSLVSITVPGVHALFLLLLGGLVAWNHGMPPRGDAASPASPSI